MYSVLGTAPYRGWSSVDINFSMPALPLGYELRLLYEVYNVYCVITLKIVAHAPQPLTYNRHPMRRIKKGTQDMQKDMTHETGEVETLNHEIVQVGSPGTLIFFIVFIVFIIFICFLCKVQKRRTKKNIRFPFLLKKKLHQIHHNATVALATFLPLTCTAAPRATLAMPSAGASSCTVSSSASCGNSVT